MPYNTSIMIDANFLYAGRASFVVRNPSNESVTVKFTKSKPKPGFLNEVFFVSIRHNNGAWAYVGFVGGRTKREIRVSNKLGFHNVAQLQKPIKVAEWALRVINGEATLPAGYTIEHTGRCGKCYKMLRDPESVALGIGPICRG